MKKYIIALKELGIEDETVIRLIQNWENSEIKNIFRDQYTSQNVELLKYQEILTNRKKVLKALDSANRILEVNQKYGIKTVIYNQKHYPSNLRMIGNPPAVLYYKGKNFSKKYEKALACIGTREPTNISMTATENLIPAWIQEDFVIVAGLAKGVDSLVHNACVQKGGKTVAVLAHGLDMIYPKENLSLSEQILANDGILVSEYPVGIKPEKFRFVNRNRIIVGLSLGVVVFECKIKSGTMRAVEFAKEQNKLIFCPEPGMVENSVYEQQKGTRYLIDKNEAIPIERTANFEVPIFKLGFNLKSDSKRLREIKGRNIYNILNNLNKSINYLDMESRLANKELTKRISFTVDKKNYLKLKKLAEDNHITLKELINSLIFSVVE